MEKEDERLNPSSTHTCGKDALVSMDNLQAHKWTMNILACLFALFSSFHSSNNGSDLVYGTSTGNKVPTMYSFYNTTFDRKIQTRQQQQQQHKVNQIEGENE